VQKGKTRTKRGQSTARKQKWQHHRIHTRTGSYAVQFVCSRKGLQASPLQKQSLQPALLPLLAISEYPGLDMAASTALV